MLLTVTYSPLDSIEGAHRNPKEHDLDGIVASIARHGFVEPLILDERTGRLLGGHGRVEALVAMRAAGEAPPEGLTPEWEVPVVRLRSRSDADADALLVALNGLTIKGGWNEAELASMLEELAATDLGLVGTGYSSDDLDRMMAGLRSQTAVDDLDALAASARAQIQPDPDDADGPRLMPADRFARISFMFTHEDRDYVATKLRWYQKRHGLDSAAAALRHLVDTIRTEEP